MLSRGWEVGDELQLFPTERGLLITLPDWSTLLISHMNDGLPVIIDTHSHLRYEGHIEEVTKTTVKLKEYVEPIILKGILSVARSAK